MRNALRSIAVAVLAVALVTESVWAAASYPISVKAFTTKATGEVVQAAHVNDLQDEVAAIEQALLTTGFEHVLKPKTTATYDLGTSTLGWQQLFLNLGTITADAQAIDVKGTWNAAGVTFTAIKANITDPASAAASLLLDLQVDGASKFKVDKAGAATFASSVGIGTAPLASAGHIRLPNAAFIRWREAGDIGDRALSLTASNTFQIDAVLHPSVDGTIDLGTSALRWRDGHFGTSVRVGSSVASVGDLRLTNDIGFKEIADPAAPAGNEARLYAKDNGAGKTQLCVRFATGASQCFATEP